MRAYLLTPLLAFAISATAQYSGPESVEYDPVGDRYFVSNTGNGTISVRTQAGAVSTFASVSTGGPHGLEVKGDTLFACSGSRLLGFLLADGMQVFNLDLGGGFNNGITTDGVHVYVTDFSGRKIFKVDPAANTFTTLVNNTGNTPNGIVFDPEMDRLWVVGWGSSAFIRSYDRVSGDQLSTFTTALGNIDGVTLDCNGDLLVASWSPNRISRFEKTFTQPVATVLSTGLSSPADIDYDTLNKVICIPNSGSNTVTLHSYTCSGVGVDERDQVSRTVIGPVPANDQLHVLQLEDGRWDYRILAIDGAIVRSGTLTRGSAINLGGLASGVYVLALPQRGERLPFTKE